MINMNDSVKILIFLFGFSSCSEPNFGSKQPGKASLAQPNNTNTANVNGNRDGEDDDNTDDSSKSNINSVSVSGSDSNSNSNSTSNSDSDLISDLIEALKNHIASQPRVTVENLRNDVMENEATAQKIFQEYLESLEDEEIEDILANLPDFNNESEKLVDEVRNLTPAQIRSIFDPLTDDNIIAEQKVLNSNNANGMVSDSGFVTTKDCKRGIENVADFNGDGKDDIMWRNTQNGSMGFWIMDSKNFEKEIQIDSERNLDWYVGGVDDFNGDCKPDIVWRNRKTGENGFWYMDGGVRLGISTTLREENTDWELVATGDFNKDGHSDFVWRNRKTGENGFWYMKDTKQLQVVSFPSESENDWEIQGAADFNKDGYLDFIWRQQKTGATGIWLMQKEKKLRAIPLDTERNISWIMGGVGSFSSKGSTDILWKNTQTGVIGIWKVTVSGDTAKTTPIEFDQKELNSAWKIVGPR